MKKGILAQLREKQPEAGWEASRGPHDWGWSWRNREDRTIKTYSALDDPYGDDDKCHSEYIDNEGKKVGSYGLIHSL